MIAVEWKNLRKIRIIYIFLNIKYRKLLSNRDVDRMIMMIFRRIYSYSNATMNKRIGGKKKTFQKDNGMIRMGGIGIRLNQKPQLRIPNYVLIAEQANTSFLKHFFFVV